MAAKHWVLISQREMVEQLETGALGFEEARSAFHLKRQHLEGYC